MPSAHASAEQEIYSTTNHWHNTPTKQGYSTLDGPLKAMSEEQWPSLSGRKQTDPASDGSDSYPLDCRPDSPTSLEDSQSESGADSSSSETTDTEHPKAPTPNGDSVLLARSKLAEQLNIVTPAPRLQVVTPPLSPAKPLPVDELLDRRLDIEDCEEIPGATTDKSHHQSPCTTNPERPAPVAVVPKTAVAQPIPKASTLSPNATPFSTSRLPARLPNTRSRAAKKADFIRLHERFPIVLPPEIEAKLSMEMVDLFEV